MAQGKEDRWGYEIIARDDAGWTDRVSRWSEGYPLVEDKVKAMPIKLALTQASKLVVKLPLPVTLLTGAVGDAIGTPIGLLIKKGMIDILTHNAEISLALAYMDDNSGIDVEVRGDYELDYRIEAFGDLRELPPLLAITPAVFGTDREPYFMRQAVVESCYLMQIKYIRTSNFARRPRAKLLIDIDV